MSGVTQQIIQQASGGKNICIGNITDTCKGTMSAVQVNYGGRNTQTKVSGGIVIIGDIIEEPKPLKHHFTITTGDWSGDGHNIDEVHHIVSNKPLDLVRHAYHTVSKNRGYDFCMYECDDFQVSKVTQRGLDFLKALGIDPDEFLDTEDGRTSADGFVCIYLEIAKIALPDLEWKWSPTKQNENIGGYGFYEP